MEAPDRIEVENQQCPICLAWCSSHAASLHSHAWFSHRLNGRCWCGESFFVFGDYVKHLNKNGGVLAHWLEFQLEGGK